MGSLEAIRRRTMANQPQWGDVPGWDRSSPDKLPSSRAEAAHSCSDCDASTGPASIEMGTVTKIRPDCHDFSFTTKDWSLEGLLKQGKRFFPIPRVSAVGGQSLEDILQRYDGDTKPLVIEGWHKHPDWLGQKFSLEWLREHGQKDIAVRNIHDWSDRTVPLEEFAKHCRSIPCFLTPGETVRWYGKDAECPADWYEWLHKSGVIPSRLLPDDPRNCLTNLPKSAAVETLMCYLGIGETFTPCHKDLCASSGHNLMCYTENDGSSFWFMTKGSDALKVAEYFRTKLKQELDHEMHVVTIEELARAPFDVYITQQKLGDLVLVPPRSCHQVVNYGGITIKTSWSRMTLSGLTVALHHELPMYQRVCRRETYRIKSTIYHTLHRSRVELEDLMQRDRPHGTEDVAARLSNLLCLFDYILKDECPLKNISNPIPAISETSGCDEKDEDIHVVCDFCGADAFQSFFECLTCVPAISKSSGSTTRGSGYALCPACYSEGRSCRCETMTAVQCRPFEVLVKERRKAVEVLKDCKALKLLPRFDCDEERDLFFDRSGVFRAACILARKRRKDTRTCTIPGSNSHLVPSTWSLYCEKCHASKCYLHLATNYRMHSVEALLLHGKGKENMNVSYHQRHVDLKRDYLKKLPIFRRATENGTIPDASIRSVFNASTLDRCKPMNPTFMKLGWYDRHADIIMTNNDPIERGVDAPEYMEGSSLSSLSSDSGSAANTPPVRGESHPSSSDKPSSSAACKNHEPMQSRKRKHVLSVMVPTLSSLKLQPQMFLLMPSLSKPTSSRREEYRPSQNDRSSAMQASQSMPEPSGKRNSAPAKTAPRLSPSAISQSASSTVASRKGDLHAGRPATNSSTTIISSPPANRSRGIGPAKTGAKSSHSTDRSSRGNGSKPSGSKLPQKRFPSKETVSGTSSSGSDYEDRSPKKARLNPPSPPNLSQAAVLKTLTFRKKPSSVSANKEQPLRSSDVERDPMAQSLADAYNSLGISERPEARSSLSNSNPISQTSVAEDSYRGFPLPDSQQPDAEATSNPTNSDDTPTQASTQQTNAGASNPELSSTTLSSHIDVPMVDDTPQIGLQQEGASAPRVSSNALAPYNDMQSSAMNNITEGITQIVIEVLQRMQVGTTSANLTPPHERNSNEHISRFGPPLNFREENPNPHFNPHYQYHPNNNRGRGRPWVPYPRNTQYHSRFDQPPSNPNLPPHNNPRYRQRGGFQMTTHSHHHHWYHPYNQPLCCEESKEAYVENTDLFIISSEHSSHVSASSTATGTPPSKVSVTSPPATPNGIPPPGAVAQPPPPTSVPPPLPPRERSPSPTQDWEDNYAAITSDL